MYKQITSQISQICSSSEKELSELFPFWQITAAKSGAVTGSQLLADGSKVQLHSSYNPEREATGAVQKLFENNNKNTVFMGFGLGYQVIAAAKEIKEKDTKLILIEPDPGYFFGALCFTDWTPVFKIENLVLAIGCPLENIMGLLEDSSRVNLGGGVSETNLFEIPAFTAHDKNYFESIKQLIERNKEKNNINAATFQKFGTLWMNNSCKNASKITEHKTVNQFIKALPSGAFGEKFLLAAAGPSLEKVLPLLPELKNHMTIVCVETALQALLQVKVEPDFILLTDPQYWAYKHISGFKAENSILVCPISVYPAVFRFQCKEILLCSDLFPVSQFYEKQLGTFGDLGAGGSVASSCWNLCKELGAKEIYFAGLDLSYPTKQTHIKGSSAEQTFHIISNRTKSADKSSISSMYSAFPEYSENYLGQKVLTDARMKMFAWWFESRIAACPEIKNFTLCPEGLKIPGVMIAEADKLVDSLKNTLQKGQSKMYSERKETSRSDLNFNSNYSVPFVRIQSLFTESYNQLQYLLNQAVEKCLVNSPDLESQLADIQKQIDKNPLKELAVMAKPSTSYLEENKTTPPQLALYQKIQKEINRLISFQKQQ